MQEKAIDKPKEMLVSTGSPLMETKYNSSQKLKPGDNAQLAILNVFYQ